MSNNIYNLFFRRLFGFKGRSGRKEYIVRFLLTTLVFILGAYTIDKYDNENSFFSFIYVIGLSAFAIVMFFQYPPLAIRRLHDLNASGWYFLITFLPFGQLLILWLMFKEGTEGANKFGECADNYNESSTTLKYNVLICSGIALFMYLITSHMLSLREDREYSVAAAKVSVEYYKRGNYEEALNGFNAAIDLTPNEYPLYSGRGSTLVKLNRFDEAISDFNKTLELNPLELHTYRKKIHVLMKQSRYTEALEICNLLLKSTHDKDHSICAYIAKAVILYKLERYDEALICTDKVLVVEADNEYALKIKNKVLQNINKP